MKNIIQTIGLLCIICFMSCSNPTSTNGSTNYEAMADELCKCMTPLVEIQQKVIELSENNNLEELQSVLANVEAISNKGDQCVEAVELKYGVVEAENEAAARQAFENACPNIAKMLGETDE